MTAEAIVSITHPPEPSVSAAEFLAQAKAQAAGAEAQEEEEPPVTMCAAHYSDGPSRPQTSKLERFWLAVASLFPLSIISAILFVVIGGQPALERIWPPSAEVVAQREWENERKELHKLVRQKTAGIEEAISEADDAVMTAKLAVWDAEDTRDMNQIAVAWQAQITAEAHLAALEAQDQQEWDVYHSFVERRSSELSKRIGE